MKTDPELRKLKVCVVDAGLYTHWALRLADFFDDVFYSVFWRTSFPKADRLLIGDGFPEIHHVKDFWKIAPEIDLFLFPDCYDGELQIHLEREMGKRVWGSRRGEELELKRERAKELLTKLSLPVNPYVICKGMDALRDYLKAHDDRYVKISVFRGVTETFHHISYKHSEAQLDELEHHLGMKKYIQPFLVESPIESVAECAMDGYVIDGLVPQSASMLGFEIKDSVLIASVMPYQDMPKQIRETQEALQSIYKGYRYRGFSSNEMRITKDGTGYLTDFTCRSASPGGELYSELYSNWDEILWYGAGGELVEPVVEARYGVQAVIKSDWAKGEWEVVEYPERIKRWVKLMNACRIRGRTCIVPQEVKQSELGYLVAIDDTLSGAIRKLKSYAEELKGFQLKVNVDALGDGVDAVRDAAKVGIKFPDELPSREEVEKL